jgi:hypothetical protein
MSIALTWFITAAALVVALVAWRRARQTAKRLDQLTQMYWELKYQHGELRVQLQRGATSTVSQDEAPPQPPPIGAAFIPLTSLKR